MPDTGHVPDRRPAAAVAPPATTVGLRRGLGMAGRRLALLLGVVLVLLVAGSVSIALRDHDSALEDGWAAAERAAFAASEQAERSLAAARLVTDRVAEAVRTDGPEAFRGAAGQAELRAMLRHAPQISSVWIMDGAGQLAASSLEAEPPRADLSDRPFFAPLAAGAASELSPLSVGRISGLWFFAYNRAVRDADGRLVAIVQAAIHAEDFARVQARLGIGPVGKVALLRAADGAPLLLHPLPRAALPNGSPPPSQIFGQTPALPAHGLAPGAEGRFEAVDRSGATLLVAWRFAGEATPFFAAAALPRDRVLAPLQVRLVRGALMSGLAAAVLAGLGWMVATALHRGAGAREAAEAGQRELAAVLEATGEAVIAVDAGWRITFLNRRAEAAIARGRDLRGMLLWTALPGAESGPFGVAYRRTMDLRMPAVVDAPYMPLGRRFRAESHPREDGGIVIFFRDVTDEHESALRLAESEGRLRAVFAAIDEGYALCEIVLDAEGRASDFRFLETNPVFGSMTGLGDISGRTLRDAVPGPHDSLVASCARVALDGQPERFEASWRGRRYDIFATAVPPHGRFAVVFRDVTERRAAEAALRESEAQLRRVLDSLFTFVGVLAPDGTLLEANRVPLEAAGLTIADVRGLLFWDCPWWGHDPEMRARARDACEKAAAGVSSRFDAVVRMAGDSRMRIDFQIAPLRDAQGRITHLIPSAIDVTARRNAEEALAESENRLRLAQEAAEVGVFERYLPGQRAHWSASMFRLYGLDPAGRGPWVSAEEHMALLHPADRATHEARRQASRGDTGQTRFAYEFRIRRADTGEVRWIASRGEIVREADGRAVLVRGVNYDVTERRRAEERQMLLAREVDHRAKNALAVVQSIIGLTRDADPERFRTAVTGRIAALARAHTLLARDGWDGAALRELVEEEVAPYRGAGPGARERVVLAGPDVELAAGAAQPVAMALHELATNAAKYGALSVPGGRVAVAWEAAPDGGLALYWTEQDGPALEGAPARRGFGSSVIRNTVERQLGGRTSFAWRPEGLAATLLLPPAQLRWPEDAGGNPDETRPA